MLSFGSVCDHDSTSVVYRLDNGNAQNEVKDWFSPSIHSTPSAGDAKNGWPSFRKSYKRNQPINGMHALTRHKLHPIDA